MDAKDLLRLLLISGIGNILEWFDFAAFGFFTPQIAASFFPAQGSKGILESFAVFAGAFVMRPVGGIIFGYIGDTYGRKRSLILSTSIMALATFGLGCLPTYATIGIAAPILLTVVRMVQGLSVGGQLVGTFVYVVESSPHRHRCFFGSLSLGLATVGTTLGSAVGALIKGVTTHDQLYSWGWRLPFLAGLMVGVAGYYMEGLAEEERACAEATQRHHVPSAQEEARSQSQSLAISSSSSVSFVENPAIPVTESDFTLLEDPTDAPHNQATGSGSGSRSAPLHGHAVGSESGGGSGGMPMRVLLSAFRAPLLVGTVVSALWCLAVYSSLVWGVTLVGTLRANPLSNALMLNSLSGMLLLVGFPVFGYIADRVGVLCVMLCGVVGITASPIFYVLLQTGSAPVVVAGQSALFLLASLWGAVIPTFLVLSFPRAYRYTAVGLCYNAAQAIFGGTAPLVQTALFTHFHSAIAPAAYISVLAVLGGIAACCGFHPSMPCAAQLAPLRFGARGEYFAPLSPKGGGIGLRDKAELHKPLFKADAASYTEGHRGRSNTPVASAVGNSML